MYNSLIVSISVKVWNVIVNGYQYSVIKKLVDLTNRGKCYLSNGSILIEGLKSKKDFIGETSFYKLSSNIIDFLSKILKYMNNRIKRIESHSLVCRNTRKLFITEESILITLFVFLLSLGFGLIGNNLIRGFYAGKSYFIAIALIGISSIGLLCKYDYKEIVVNSFICQFIFNIFTIDDEGGANWW